MDEKIPKFISDRVDVKASTVLFFSETLQCIKESDSEAKPSPDTKVIVLTNFGTVEGDIGVLKDADKKPGQIINDTIFKLRNEAFSELPDNPIIINNSTVLIINNAVIKTFQGSTHKFELFNLFSDQIVGFTFGTNNSA